MNKFNNLVLMALFIPFFTPISLNALTTWEIETVVRDIIFKRDNTKKNKFFEEIEEGIKVYTNGSCKESYNGAFFYYDYPLFHKSMPFLKKTSMYDDEVKRWLKTDWHLEKDETGKKKLYKYDYKTASTIINKIKKWVNETFNTKFTLKTKETKYDLRTHLILQEQDSNPNATKKTLTPLQEKILNKLEELQVAILEKDENCFKMSTERKKILSDQNKK